METFLKKHAKAHKYKSVLTTNDIDIIVSRHVPKLKSIQVLNFGSKTDWPEVTDEYYEKESKIISEVRADLQKAFMNKIKFPQGSTSLNALKHYLHNI